MLTLPHAQVVVSFVISTRNRKKILFETLCRVRGCGLSRESFEIFIIDNASTDGTADAVRQYCPDVKLLALDSNRGSCAKSLAISATRGRYVIFLDDDSYPSRGSVARMIEHFRKDSSLGAAGFNVMLPDRTRECSAYPDVLIGCGAGFRRTALVEVGALPDDFFMQAEEYDLTLRLMNANWKVQTFDDLHVIHLKTPVARAKWRTMRLDVRNNVLVALRNLPSDDAGPIARDWLRRYWRMASVNRQRSAFVVGLAQGLASGMSVERSHTVDQSVLERFTRSGVIERRMRTAANQLMLQRVLFVDYGKNMLPYWRAAKACGLEVVAIADNRLAGSGSYRSVKIVSDRDAQRMMFDAVIISNSSPVHAANRATAWRNATDRPVIDLLDQSVMKLAA